METDLLSQKRFELLLEMAQKKYDKELTGLREQIAALQGAHAQTYQELTVLRSDFSKLSVAPAQMQPQQNFGGRVESVVHPEPVPSHIQQTGPAQNGNSRFEPLQPRFGKYTPEDVSVDKFFYFGKK